MDSGAAVVWRRSASPNSPFPIGLRHPSPAFGRTFRDKPSISCTNHHIPVDFYLPWVFMKY